jgi:hypothetical protein
MIFVGSRCHFMALRRKAFAAFTSRFLFRWKSTHGAGELAPALLQFRRVMLHPPQNRRLRQAQAPFAHHGDQVSITELKAQVPAHAQDNDLPIEVSTFEQVLDRYESPHPSIIAECERVLHQSLLAKVQEGAEIVVEQDQSSGGGHPFAAPQGPVTVRVHRLGRSVRLHGDAR